MFTGMLFLKEVMATWFLNSVYVINAEGEVQLTMLSTGPVNLI
jgi:hypothetical protein